MSKKYLLCVIKLKSLRETSLRNIPDMLPYNTMQKFDIDKEIIYCMNFQEIRKRFPCSNNKIQWVSKLKIFQKGRNTWYL